MIPERFKAAALGVIFALAAFSVITAAKVFDDGRDEARPIIHTFFSNKADEDTDTTKASTELAEFGKSDNLNIINEAAEQAGETTQSAAVTVAFPLDINAASKSELMQIKGIGSVTAENILSYREEYGYFLVPEDLLKVDGIGEKKLGMLKGYIYINSDIFPQTSAAARAEPITTQPPETTPPEVTAAAETAEFEMVIEEFVTEKDRDTSTERTYPSSSSSRTKKLTESEEDEDEYYPDFPLELNSATAKDLTYINGIGEALAQRIVEYARTFGFYDVDELLNVRGIGESKLAEIRPYVYVDTSGLPPKPDESETTSETTATTSTTTESSEPDTDTSTSKPEIYRVNLNTCTVQDLMQLPGIDEELANNIIELRNKIGYFAKIEEIGFAEGMTLSIMAGIMDYIYV